MSISNPEEVDRLSDLPEPLLLQILSLLPSKFAVRTSILARRFRYLWRASSSLELDRSDFPPGRLFNDVVSRCLRLRDPTPPLRTLCLKTKSTKSFHTNLITKWLNSANSLGMRHLSLHMGSDSIESLFPLIIGFQSLETLVIDAVDLDWIGYLFRPLIIPPTFSQTELKYLHIKAKITPSDLTLFISGLTNLEHLWVEPLRYHDVVLSSLSVKILKLTSKLSPSKLSLSFPSLEFLDLNISIGMVLKQCHVEMPILRSAVVTIPGLCEEDVPVLCGILRSVSNVSELTLHIGTPYPKRLVGAARRRKHNEFDLFHPLVEPGKDMVIFPNLRSLRLSMCFYGNVLQDLICLLRHSPVIDSLHLIHEDRPSDWERTPWAPDVWHSRLPLNSEGNRKYADFTSLNTGDKKVEAIKLLSCENLSKKRKM